MSILTHHNDRSCEGGLAAERKVHKNTWIGIKMENARNRVPQRPDAKNGGLSYNKSPTPHRFSNFVRELLAQRESFFEFF